MKFMLISRATAASEAGELPTEAAFAAMEAYTEELSKAGVLLDLAGLHPSSKGAKIRVSGGRKTVVDGPFTEAKELIAGYMIIQVPSREDAVAWALRAPADADGEIEIRQLFELDDLSPSDAIEQMGRELERPPRG